MKKLILIAALSLIIGKLDARPHQVWARSFMDTHPAYQQLSMRQAFWHNIIYNKTGPIRGSFRATGFYQKSFPMNKTAHYFLPPCIQDVLVAGDDTPENVQCARTIRAEWLGLDPTFRGSFTICPQQVQYGFSLEYNQDLKTLLEVDFLENYWISIAMPIVAVFNAINLQEALVHAPIPQNPDQPRTLYEAFRQPSWCYAQIGKNTKSIRPAEIRLTVGNSLISENYYQFAYNTFFIAPTGNKQNARNLFQAVAGNNQHFAFGGAIFFQFPLNRDISEHGVCFFTNLETTFNIRNTQYRTLDLKGKPWSRYLLFNQKCDPANNLRGAQNIPGVNILTHKVLVRPYGVFDFSMGWRFATPTIEVECGYNIWGKSNEKVELKRPWFHPCEYAGIFGIAGNPADNAAFQPQPLMVEIASQPRPERELPPESKEPLLHNPTASRSTIAQQAPNDTEFIAIDIYDLDPKSAESGSVLNHKVHISVGGRRDRETLTTFCVTGAYIEIPQKNAALRVWGAWFSIGASF